MKIDFLFWTKTWLPVLHLKHTLIATLALDEGDFGLNLNLTTLTDDVQEMVDVVEVVPEKPTIGKAFKKEGKVVMDYLAQMGKESIKEFEDKLTDSG